MRTQVFVFGWLLAIASVAMAQTASPRTGSITGRVVVTDGGVLWGARISLYASQENASRALTTDADGNFAAHGLSAQLYRVSVSLPGYVTANQDDAGRLARIGDHLTLTLVKGGAITGRVTDPKGKPIVGLRVSATRVRDETGAGSQSQRGMVMRLALTDDRGEYRLFGLLAGAYFVMTSGSNYSISFEGSPYLGDVPVFHPSNSRDTAAEVKVQLGSEMSGIDIRYRSTLGYTISGKVLGAVAVGEGTSVSVSLSTVGRKQTIATASVDTRREQNGFELIGVPAGEYEISALSTDREGRGGLAVPRPLRVTNASLNNLDLTLTTLASVTGKVVLEPASVSSAEAQSLCVVRRPKALSEVFLNLRQTIATNEQPLFTNLIDNSYSITTDGLFKFTRVPSGAYRLLADLPGDDWYVKSIATNGPNSLDLLAPKAGEHLSNITVTLAEGAAQLTGQLESRFTQPMRVHLIPAEASLANDVLRYAEAAVLADGTFALRQFAPGKYWLLMRQADESVKRPLAWDATTRAALRQAAAAAPQIIELGRCMRIRGYKLKP